jgi:hypothetical protein
VLPLMVKVAEAACTFIAGKRLVETITIPDARYVNFLSLVFMKLSIEFKSLV